MCGGPQEDERCLGGDRPVQGEQMLCETLSREGSGNVKKTYFIKGSDRTGDMGDRGKGEPRGEGGGTSKRGTGAPKNRVLIRGECGAQREEQISEKRKYGNFLLDRVGNVRTGMNGTTHKKRVFYAEKRSGGGGAVGIPTKFSPGTPNERQAKKERKGESTGSGDCQTHFFYSEKKENGIVSTGGEGGQSGGYREAKLNSQNNTTTKDARGGGGKTERTQGAVS